MIRLYCALALILSFPVSLAAQAQADSGSTGEVAGTVVIPAPPPEPADTAMAGRPLLERAVGGAVVGAVTGGALSAQGLDCAPSESPGTAIAFGAIWGFIRGALGFNPSADDLPVDTSDNGGTQGPFPFDDEKCEPTKPQSADLAKTD